MGIEAESTVSQPGVFQISQRADFFSVLVSIDTMNKRPLVNTRDEPHADVNRYRRFHVIIGDANMSEWATALKVGTTALVLGFIERDEAPQLESRSRFRRQNRSVAIKPMIGSSSYATDERFPPSMCNVFTSRQRKNRLQLATKKRRGSLTNGRTSSTILSGTQC